MKLSNKLIAAAMLMAASSVTYANDLSENTLSESVNIALATEMASVRYTLAVDTFQDVIDDVTDFCQSMQQTYQSQQLMLAAQPNETSILNLSE